MGYKFNDRKNKARLGNQSPELVGRARRFSTEKALGQCFLVDENILDASVDAANLSKFQDTVVEIGPGIGFLTERMVEDVDKLFAVELDASTLTSLRILAANHKNLTIRRGDFLQTYLGDLLSIEAEKDIKEIYEYENPDEHFIENPKNPQNVFVSFTKFGEEKGRAKEILEGVRPKAKVVANIPYQISSKILVHLLGEIGEKSPNQDFISEIYILVQKEFAERLMVKDGRAKSAIGLLVNYWADVEYLLDVPRICFHPQPKVDSAFIKIKLLDKPRVECAGEPARSQELRRLIKAIFENRRKTLANGLKLAGYNKELVDSLDLGNLRGETMSLEEINELAQKLNS